MVAIPGKQATQTEIPSNVLIIPHVKSTLFLNAVRLTKNTNSFITMDLFFEAKFLAIIFTMLFGAFIIDVCAELIDCIKSDECSCKTNTKPQQEISLWSIPR